MGLPKRYAKMGFKKGWRAYKASKRSSSTKSYSKKRGVNMARRRRSIRKHYRRNKTSYALAAKLVTAGVYGASRAKINEFVSPYAQKLPVGGAIADNVGMLIALYGVKRFVGGKVPYISQVADAGMIVEAAMLGSDLITGM